MPQEEQETAWTAALASVGAIKDDPSRVRVLRVLAPYLPQEVQKVASTIEDERYRSQVLKTLASHLPQEVLMATSAITDMSFRGDVVVEVTTSLLHLPRMSLYSSLKAFLVVSASRNRKNLFWDIRCIIPMIQRLGGQEALSETLQALQDVAEWWP